MLVVRIQGRNIFGFSASLALTATGEQWLDDFVAKDNKRGHGAKPFAGYCQLGNFVDGLTAQDNC
jgi:hypothetical protein